MSPEFSVNRPFPPAGAGLKFYLIRGKFPQAILAETVTVILRDPDEILLKDLIAFTPAILITQAFKFCLAARAGFDLRCDLHISGSGSHLLFQSSPLP